MAKIKIWYYATVEALDNEGSVFEDYPVEIVHEGKKRTIKLHKDYFENVVINADYGD